MTGRPRGQEGNPDRWPPVSVIVPARNAQATLPATLDSILAQDYGGVIDVIVADGSDTAATRDLLRVRFPSVRQVPNPEGTIPCGLNRALAIARHDIIARCDAHATLPPDYLARAVRTLQRTGAANVGGRQNPVGTTRFERARTLTNSPRDTSSCTSDGPLISCRDRAPAAVTVAREPTAASSQPKGCAPTPRAVGVQRLVSLRFLVRTRMAAPRLERPYQPSR